MTIADDIQSASRGEMAGLRAQLAGAERALSKVMGELTEAREDVARFEAELDKSNRELARLAKEHSEAIDHRNNLRGVIDNMADALAARGAALTAMTEMRDTWKRVALAYRADRNEWAEPYGLASSMRTWSIQRRSFRREVGSEHR